jgi:hypothetical protein
MSGEVVVTLLIMFGMLAIGFTALFLGGSIIAQGMLYERTADRIPLRAIVGGLILGGFLTFWASIDKKKPGQYDTFFNFAPYTTTEFQEFEAVRWIGTGDGKLRTDANGKPEEVIVKFKRATAAKDAKFLEEGNNEAFKLNGSTSTGAQYMVGAIRVKGPTDNEPVRYNALLKDESKAKVPTYTQERKFVEDKGSRYVEFVQLGTLFVPSSGIVAISLLLNFTLLLLWFVVAWPVLRYTVTHSLGIAIVGTLVTMLALMPLLFKFARDPKPAPAPAANAMLMQNPANRFV